MGFSNLTRRTDPRTECKSVRASIPCCRKPGKRNPPSIRKRPSTWRMWLGPWLLNEPKRVSTTSVAGVYLIARRLLAVLCQVQPEEGRCGSSAVRRRSNDPNMVAQTVWTGSAVHKRAAVLRICGHCFPQEICGKEPRPAALLA